MQIDLVKIGNSQGIRLPKAVIEQAGLTEKLNLEIEDGAIVIRPVNSPRAGWAEAAAACRAAGEDRLEEWDATIGDFDGEWE